MKNKKIIIGIVIGVALILLLLGLYWGYNYFKVKNAVIIVDLTNDLNAEFLSEVKVSDFIENINGTIVDDYVIDTTQVGEKEINFEYINEDNIKINYDYKINVVDTVAPVVWLGSSYSVNVGSKIDLTQKIMCGDNYDNNPKCEIIGEYDVNKEGSYPLVFKATDNSGNVTEKSFNLKVNKPVKGSSNGTTTTTAFSDVVKKHKTENTEIGLDISHWQGDIDFNKLKEAGVEFVFIKVGGTKGIDGEYVMDSKFIQNITGANEAGIPVGIYFYSYANSDKNAINDAKWVLDQIKDYKVDLPIALDWENWSFYNDFNLSFFGLTNMANSFLDEITKAGYEGLLYSSKNYLEKIWMKKDYPAWLAHYTNKTNYEGEYTFWQICSNGKVDGIKGAVDIDIRYK